jgi:hypothetical protein
MAAFAYRYELREGAALVSTGHLTREEPFEVGDRIVLGRLAGVVRSIDPVLGERELRLVVQLRREGGDS